MPAEGRPGQARRRLNVYHILGAAPGPRVKETWDFAWLGLVDRGDGRMH